MGDRLTGQSWALPVVAIGTLLAGCAQTPLGPSVQVMPGPGKSFETFQSDQANCKGYAAAQVQGQAEAANQQAVGTAVLGTVLGAGLGAATGSLGGVAGGGAAVGAAAGAGLGTSMGAAGSGNAQMGIQAQYDNAFAQCMYAKGELVPGFAPVAAGPVASGADPALVRGVQRELIRLNYLHDVADGSFGPRTAAAIRQYQQASGLPVDPTPSDSLLAKLQATPTSQSASTAAAAPTNWVAPAQAGAAPATAMAPAAGNWVAPTKPGVTPAAAPAPAAPSTWVAPAPTQ